ncbi:hypothetical protein HDC92_002860 [Pedobacter sp. AK017]|uniref:DUF2971 domain-containing protein n=1 Tax=Pedobacter sp. AK017 TaxID=2723073 RepID=UPI00161F8A5E|nr:DUF2971 domain-containing protein [Pedobacter sp. AK017]MBB5439173.1 hypothetical protein [Pedobacter sp. AK017]
MLTDTEFKQLGDEGLKKVLSADRHFKYVNLHDGLEYVLKTNTFKFTHPGEFNDPFDCNEKMIDVVISPQIEKQFILEAGAKHGLPRKEIRKHFNKIGGNSHYHKILKEKKKDFKVSCFSEISDDVLMWSHYADKHKGMCIGFDLNLICPDYVLYPVNYIDEVQKIDGMANTPYVFYYWATFKAARWSYEREIRAVSKNGKSIIVYPKDAVREVIFGCNVKQSEIVVTIKALKKLRYKGILLSQMTIDGKTMQLKKIPLKY